MSNDRVDENGRAYKGSQHYIQHYVNTAPEILHHMICASSSDLAAHDPDITWVSPLQSKSYLEYRDRDFLKAVGLESRVSELVEFWPNRGPVWDALAVTKSRAPGGSPGVILVEAKSYPKEVYGTGTAASEASRRTIEAALDRTAAWIGIARSANWTGSLYQSANRLAHLYFLREILGVPAWLINVCFVDDPHVRTTGAAWRIATDQIKDDLGLVGVKLPYYSDIFLMAR